MSKKNIDPNFEREAAKYDDPIPSREFILSKLAGEQTFLDEIGVGRRVGVRSKRHLAALQKRLRAMVRDGQLIENRQGRVRVLEGQRKLEATIVAHPDGFGFGQLEIEHDDVFIAPKSMRGVLHGDRVLLVLSGPDDKDRYEGWVAEILERGMQQISGKAVFADGDWWLMPTDNRVTCRVMITNPEGLENGMLLQADITGYPKGRVPMLVKVTETLDAIDGLNGQILQSMQAREMPMEFDADLLAEAAALGSEVAEADKTDRVDLRDMPFITIDGEDARDFDDAVYAKKTDSGWKLWVAIADVAHYVPQGGLLDQSAYARGTSVYFPNKVVPMLPEAISNGLCSLNPHVDRLAMVCEMRIDAEGQIKASKFYNGLICSQRRCTYTEVNQALFLEQSSEIAENSGVWQSLQALKSLYAVLRQSRDVRGAMDFDLPEPKFELDDELRVSGVYNYERNDAHKLIEECMITANVAAASYLTKHKMPTLMRIHDGPKSDRLDTLHAFLKTKALVLGGGYEPTVHDYAALAKQIAGRPDAALLQSMMLRSMNQARYAPEEAGHFGLALEQYAHFTSPIRRYPDLCIHRMLKHVVAKQKPSSYDIDQEGMMEIGEHCSMTERRAEETVREVLDWLKCDYMSQHVGEHFDGVVSSVTAFGAFVSLNDLYIDGLIHVTNLPRDYYDYDQTTVSLVGRDYSRAITMGDDVTVQVASVNPDERRIDFALVSELKKVPRISERKSERPSARKPRTPTRARGADRSKSTRGRR